MTADKKKETPKTKKVWQKPDFVILDSNDVNAKNQADVREATGVPGASLGAPGFFSTPHHNVWNVGTKYQAIS